MPSLARNTLFLTVASVGQKAIAFLYFTVIARTIGVEHTGSYFLALAFVVTIGVLDDIGLTSVLIREIAKTPGNATSWLKNVLGYKCVTMPLTVVMACFLPALLGYQADAAGLIRLGVVIMLADTLSLTLYGVLRGLQVLKYESLGMLVGQSLTTALGAIFILTGHGTVPLLIIALTIGSVWNLIFAGVQVARRLGLGAFVPSFSLGLMPVRTAFAFFLAAIFVKIYSYTDSFILYQTIGDAAVGLYSVAYKLTYAFQFLPLAFIGALYPTFASKAHYPEALKKILFEAEWYLALLVAPIVFGIFSLAPEIVTYFYTTAEHDFSGAIFPLQILIFVLIFIFLDFPLGALLNSTGRQATKTLIMGLTLVVNVTMNFILIPRFGVSGASVSALIGFIFMFLAGWVAVARAIHVRFIDLLRHVVGLLFAGVCMAVVVVPLKSIIPWMLTIPVGAAVFMTVTFLTKSFTVDHLHTFKSLLGRPKYDQTPPTNA